MKVSFTPEGCGFDGILVGVAAIALDNDRVRRNAVGLKELGGETSLA
jgi:hypothetical protein